MIQSEIEEYFRKELVKVRSYAESKWKQDTFQIFIDHVGNEHAQKIAEFMGEKENCEGTNEKSYCD